MGEQHGRVYVLRLRAPPQLDDPTRHLRWILKRLLRQHGFRCEGIEEVETGTKHTIRATDDV